MTTHRKWFSREGVALKPLDIDSLHEFSSDESGNLYWKDRKVRLGIFLWKEWLPIIISLLALIFQISPNFSSFLGATPNTTATQGGTASAAQQANTAASGTAKSP